LKARRLSFAVSASDPDVPANALSYALTSAPPGASIDALSGVFTWTPTESQGPGSHTITVQVTDNGSPALSATANFQVIVTESEHLADLAAIAIQDDQRRQAAQSQSRRRAIRMFRRMF
jgi:hypothetical protein